MNKKNRECVICGKEYEYCNRCGEHYNRPTWMSMFCCEECKNIYEACAGNIAGHYNDEETKKLLDMCDIKKVSEKPVLILNVIKKLYKEEEQKETVEEVAAQTYDAQKTVQYNNYQKKNKKKNR